MNQVPAWQTQLLQVTVLFDSCGLLGKCCAQRQNSCFWQRTDSFEWYLWTFNHTSLKYFLLWKGKRKVMKSNGSSHVNSLLKNMALYAAGGGCLRLDSQQVIEPWKDPLKTSQFRKPPYGFQVYVVVLMQWGGDPIIPSNIFLVSLWLVWSQLSWSCHIVWWPKMLEFNTQISSCCLAVAEDGIKKSNKIESPQSGWSQRQI